MKKKNALKFIIIITLILLTLTSVFCVIVSEPKHTEAAEIDASNWSTYRNEKFLYEIKYPNNYDIYQSEDRVYIGDQRIVDWGILIIDQPRRSLGLIEWLKDYPYYSREDFPDKPNKIVSGLPSVEICKFGEDFAHCSVFIERYDKILEIDFFSRIEDKSLNKKLYDAVISNLKFI